MTGWGRGVSLSFEFLLCRRLSGNYCSVNAVSLVDIRLNLVTDFQCTEAGMDGGIRYCPGLRHSVVDSEFLERGTRGGWRSDPIHRGEAAMNGGTAWHKVYGSRRHKKNGPRFRRGPSCLGSLALRELFWRPYGGVAVGARMPRRKDLGFYGLSAPVEEVTPWGDVAPWAAKLFAITRTCTSLVFFIGLVSSPAEATSEATWALPRAT